MIVGIEFDQRDGGQWADIPHPVQFCQWTIAAAPGHPVFEAMLARIRAALPADVSAMAQWRPTSFEVMNATGPAAWTDVLFAQLQAAEPRLAALRDLSGRRGPRVYGDILVLDIDGFGVGQAHSGSTNDGTFPEGALVKHRFWGSWRASPGAQADDPLE